MDWRIVPFVGIDVIRFGRLRSEVRSELGEGFVEFKKDVGARLTDAYDKLGMHLYYDAMDRLECIEVFDPADVSFVGVALLERDCAEVVTELTDLGYCGQEINVGYGFDDQGFSLYAPRSKVEGVTIFRRGYYDNSLSFYDDPSP